MHDQAALNTTGLQYVSRHLLSVFVVFRYRGQAGCDSADHHQSNGSAQAFHHHLRYVNPDSDHARVGLAPIPAAAALVPAA